MSTTPSFLRNYRFSFVLIGSILLGSAIGVRWPAVGSSLKPLGDIFLNLLFAAVVPLIFFSISSAVAGMASTQRLFRILGWMLLVFTATGIIASLLMALAVQVYPPAQGVRVVEKAPEAVASIKASEQIVKAFTVGDFVELLSKRNVLAMIFFSMLVGLAASTIGEKGRAFREFLASANEVFTKIISFIMYYAPVGLGAYFAYLVAVEGPKLLGDYLRAMILYYPLCIAYFFIAFTAYAYLAGRGTGVRRFWGNILPASLTAAATGSSFATIPLNIEAAERVGVPRDISEVVIPVGATIHMDGSCLAAILKIAFLFGFYNMDFSGAGTIATAIGVSILAGMVVSGIPGGGVTGEILIITLYGFPIEALPIINMIGNLVDPPATLVNAVGDNVASMMITRILHGKDWLHKQLGQVRLSVPGSLTVKVERPAAKS